MSSSVSDVELRFILEGLDSPEEELRRIAVEQLQMLPAAETAPRLVECLGDESWRVRKAAVEGLVSYHEDPFVQDRLVESLADGENPGRRNSAFEALVACGSRVTSRLVRELANHDADVRKLVIDGLAAIGDPTSRAALTQALDDPDPNVRGAAAEALGVVGGRDEMACLLRVANARGEEVLVRLSALRALADTGSSPNVSDLVHALDDALLRPAALELLGHSEDPAAREALIKGLGCSRLSSREAAISGLLRVLSRLDGAELEALRARLREVAATHDRLVESACDRLESADLAHRMVLVQFLGLLDDSRVVLPILAAGGDEALAGISEATLENLGARFPEALAPVWHELDFDLKRRACRGLGRVGGACAEGLLAHALAGPDPELRCEAALALGRSACLARLPELVRSLERAARDDDPESREEVASLVDALVEMARNLDAPAVEEGGELIEALIGRLGGAPEPVRLAVARVLACIGRAEDADTIGLLLKDESPAVRRAAVKALSRLDFERAEEPLRLALVDESGAVRIAAAQVLGESDRIEALDDLRPLLMDDDPNVAAVALRALGTLHRDSSAASEEVHGLLRSALESGPIAALAACEALMEIGGPRAGDLARSALDRTEPEVLRAAIACLAAHGDDKGLTRLFELVSHPDWSVRAEAIQVLADRGVRAGLPTLLRRLGAEKDEFVRDMILRATRRLEG